jgi:predicted component of type VI protein secretion system
LTARPSSLSLWQDIESLMAFAYAGVHAEALKNARNWNHKERLAAAGALVGRGWSPAGLGAGS